MNLVELRVTTTGSTGAALGSATTPQTISGKIVAVVLNYHADCHSNTEVNLYMAIAPSDLILDYATHKVDICLHPRKQVCEADGTVLTYDGSEKVVDYFVVHGKLTLAVTLCDELTDAVVAYIFYE